jgi:hypothetical protein
VICPAYFMGYTQREKRGLERGLIRRGLFRPPVKQDGGQDQSSPTLLSKDKELKDVQQRRIRRQQANNNAPNDR